jgi:hypothetical protein
MSSGFRISGELMVTNEDGKGTCVSFLDRPPPVLDEEASLMLVITRFQEAVARLQESKDKAAAVAATPQG